MTLDAPKDENSAYGVEEFITRWSASGGAERSNYQGFLRELCTIISAPKPDPAQEDNRYNKYVFERSVAFKHADGSQTTGFIDLYKRDCFVLEAKQSASRKAKKATAPDQIELLPEDHKQVKLGTAKRGTTAWVTAMTKARKQAEGYAKALPKEHGWPPFLVVVDVGYCIELFADFSGQGKNYAQFPDRRSFRIMLDDLREQDVRERLYKVWTDPKLLDPTRISAEVTRDIAERLAKIARGLEGRGHDAKLVAEFLMRCLFTMFAEDVGLLPGAKFADLLEELKANPTTFKPMLEDLWRAMDRGDFSAAIKEQVRRFNGGLFASHEAITLEADEIHDMWVAAKRDWREVEPAIFGTLLERALDKRERAKLGAHYTPRAYVERLVIPTIIEPVTEDWNVIQAQANQLLEEGKPKLARKVVRDFHRTLCETRVLDPACGTGNFLYVAMELMKRLEGEVLDYLAEIGEDQYLLELSDHTVDPHQFLGLEINPRAVQIADLVLWIGFIKWQLRTGGQNAITEPVLKAFGNIAQQDAVLAYDRQELLRDDEGKPITRWDGETTKLHPITGEEVPDESARVETYTYLNPRPATWPKADFVAGNPPFVAGKDMRFELGGGYAEACWKARPHVPGGADFVMHFWDKAGELLRTGMLRRFGLITTNSLTQTFSRRVIEHHLLAKYPLSLVFAIPDHPWLKSVETAAVRIAMTVAAAGERTGYLRRVLSETGIDTDQPKVELDERLGQIRSDLRIGAKVTSVARLLANQGLSSPGVKLHGAGFIVTPAEAMSLGLGTVKGLEEYIRPYRNGRDLTQTPRGVMIIDLFPLTEQQVRDRFPAIYQWLLERVKPEREAKRGRSKDMDEYADKWWVFGKVRQELRGSLDGLQRYIATVETSKHRFFQFLDAVVRPDNMLVNMGLEEPACLSILSSRLHVVWALAAGGRLGVGNDPRYNKTRCFDPFTFPDFDALPQSLVASLCNLGERLDTFRKERQEEHADLTMTAMYNGLERIRRLEDGIEAEPLTKKEKAFHVKGLISILKQIHDDIDRTVFEAYGWDDMADRLVGRPGATMPLPDKPEDQAEAEEELLVRLVALNQARAEEERQGKVRWLRPDYQVPKLGHKVVDSRQIEAEVALPVASKRVPKWPSDLPEQIRLVRTALEGVAAPIKATELSKHFSGGRNRAARVEQLLGGLVMLGQAHETDDGYFVPRER